MMCRSSAEARGHASPAGAYLRSAWRFALVGSVAALAALMVAR